MIDWLRAFKPDERLRQLILDTINAEARAGHSGEDETVKRRELLAQLERLRDLYVLGDLTKSQYVMRRQAIEEEMQRIKPPADPDLERAQALLEDFARFWEAEREPGERRKVLSSLFERIWQKDGTIVAVKPQAPFASYFTATTRARADCADCGTRGDVAKKPWGDNDGSDGGRVRRLHIGGLRFGSRATAA